MSHSMTLRSSKDMEDTLLSRCNANTFSISLKNIEESKYNMYGGQQICCFRDSDLKKDLNDVLDNNNLKLKLYLQEIYDMGCALIDMEIVIKKNGKFKLNKEFPDYSSWEFAKERVIKNCLFLEEAEHPKFINL